MSQMEDYPIDNDHPSGNQKDTGPMGQAAPSEEAKISPAAPALSDREEREVVSDSNDKEIKENDLLYDVSKGEMPDFVLQSLRGNNSHEAGPADGRRSGSPADSREGGTNVSPAEVPGAIADEISSTEDESSVVRDTIKRTVFAPREGAATTALASYYSSGQSHINEKGGEKIRIAIVVFLLMTLQSATAGCLYFRVLL